MNERWRVWTMTAAFYDSQDPLSFVFALSSLLPIVIVIFVAGLASATLSPQQTPALILLLGFIHNTVLNAVLKAFIQSPRPNSRLHDTSYKMAPSLHGMPSDHAQFMFFFTTWLVRKAGIYGIPIPLGMWAFLLLSSIFVSYGRIYNEFHTTIQVLVGVVLGILNAYLCTTPIGDSLLRQVAIAVAPIREFCIGWTQYIR
ncbi:PAP2 family protein [Trypanosoma theileri]|uniref:PAP2 family protein n=1 Tax=Trypanosoma theileri TaxID=67003 RepID=A0A1X0P264_9TRYP|nr:PAP2 family protein [Trypanosoma theileri]ORC91044.1 PAP2 family protein [Trypanosoma theileri]